MSRFLNSTATIVLIVIGVVVLILIALPIVAVIYVDNYKNPADKKLAGAGIV